ncbi:Hypothetical protein HVR_LOCUS800 [uncultured virus]|nr:Hypothetical protein HVR_LOCUS800 [uncultured virus]
MDKLRQQGYQGELDLLTPDQLECISEIYTGSLQGCNQKDLSYMLLIGRDRRKLHKGTLINADNIEIGYSPSWLYIITRDYDHQNCEKFDRLELDHVHEGIVKIVPLINKNDTFFYLLLARDGSLHLAKITMQGERRLERIPVQASIFQISKAEYITDPIFLHQPDGTTWILRVLKAGFKINPFPYQVRELYFACHNNDTKIYHAPTRDLQKLLSLAMTDPRYFPGTDIQDELALTTTEYPIVLRKEIPIPWKNCSLIISQEECNYLIFLESGELKQLRAGDYHRDPYDYGIDDLHHDELVELNHFGPFSNINVKVGKIKLEYLPKRYLSLTRLYDRYHVTCHLPN